MPRPPPPNPLPTMSGNFDFPPASDPPASSDGGAENIIQQLHQTLEREREQERAARESAARQRQDIYIEVPMPPRRSRPPAAVPSRSRRNPRHSNPNDRLSRDASLRRLPPPAPATANFRPRATPSERYQSFHRQRLQREPQGNNTDSLEHLNGRDSDFPNLFSFGPPSTSSSNRRSPPGDLEGRSRRPKRRKLEHEGSTPSSDGFRYGHHGQVVPGRLKMEIVSCDGGEYEEFSHGLHKIENVLKNDKSVYCTQSSRCNLLLTHHGETTFCLEKLVIKAPERGFTAPVQEGMVFVSMSSSELLAGTSGYKISYSSPSSPHSSNVSSPSRSEELLSFQESLNDPDVWANSRSAREEAMEEQIERLDLQHNQYRRSQIARRILGRLRNRERDQDTIPSSINANLPENCDWPVTESFSTNAVGVSAPTPPPFTITTESDGESDHDDGQPSAAVMADRLRRDSRWRPDSEDEDDDFMPLTSANWPPGRHRRDDAGYIRASRLRTPSRIEVKDAEAEGTENMIPPHARFFIAKHKNKITIKFDPPVSGKFVLLKLWSPLHDGNIDIESVLFHGFSGPRYFPACQLR